MRTRTVEKYYSVESWCESKNGSPWPAQWIPCGPALMQLSEAKAVAKDAGKDGRTRILEHRHTSRVVK